MLAISFCGGKFRNKMRSTPPASVWLECDLSDLTVSRKSTPRSPGALDQGYERGEDRLHQIDPDAPPAQSEVRGHSPPQVHRHGWRPHMRRSRQLATGTFDIIVENHCQDRRHQRGDHRRPLRQYKAMASEGASIPMNPAVHKAVHDESRRPSPAASAFSNVGII